jgi:hypothetical protein
MVKPFGRFKASGAVSPRTFVTAQSNEQALLGVPANVLDSKNSHDRRNRGRLYQLLSPGSPDKGHATLRITALKRQTLLDGGLLLSHGGEFSGTRPMVSYVGPCRVPNRTSTSMRRSEERPIKAIAVAAAMAIVGFGGTGSSSATNVAGPNQQ